MSKQFSLEDALFLDTGLKGVYTQENRFVKYTSLHNGQIKLAMMEILFICNYVLPHMKKTGKTNATIIYAGAAPGDHIPALLNMFPMISFDLYDPAPFSITSTLNTYGDRLRINNRPMKEGAIKMIRERYGDEDVYFISDVRLPFDSIGSGTEITNNLSTMNDMRMQLEWHRDIKAVYSSLKFHLPYIRFEGREVMNRYVEYADGDLYWQPFARQNGGETRLIVSREYKTKFYDCRDNEDLHAYQNYVRRQMATYLNPLDGSTTGLSALLLSMVARSEKIGKSKNTSLIEKTELKAAHLDGRDFDSMYCIWILQQYLRVTGNISGKALDVHNMTINLMLEILKTIDKFRGGYISERQYISTGKTTSQPIERSMVDHAVTNWFTLQQVRSRFIRECYNSFGFVPSNNSFTRYVLLSIKKNELSMLPLTQLNVTEYPSLQKLGENMLTTNRAVVGRYENMNERDTGIADMITYVNDLIIGAGITADVLKPLDRKSSDYDVLITYARIMLNQLMLLKSDKAKALQLILDADVDEPTLWATIAEMSTLNLRIDIPELTLFYDKIAASTQNIKLTSAIIIQVPDRSGRSSMFYAVPSPKYEFMTITTATSHLASYFDIKMPGRAERYDAAQIKRIVEHFNIIDVNKQKFTTAVTANLRSGMLTLGYLMYTSGAVRVEIKNEFTRSLMKNSVIGLSTIYNYGAIYADLYRTNSSRYGPGSEGFKRSVPYGTFMAMRQYYNINLELYASYFDNVLTTYASIVHTDTMHPDYPALGDSISAMNTALQNFDEINVQANPPYMIEYVQELVKIMKSSLPSEKPVRFIVILPAIDQDLNNTMETELNEYMKGRVLALRGTSAYIVGNREIDLGTSDEYETDVDIMLFSNRDDDVAGLNFIQREFTI